MATATEQLLLRIDATTESLRRELKRAEQGVERSTKKMDKDLRKFDRSFDKLNAKMAKFGSAIRVAFGALAIRQIATFATDTVGQIDRIAKTADKIGLTTDSLQELRFAASQSGVEQKTLDMAMQRFSRRVGEAAQGSGELVKTLEQYNIATKDSQGNTRSLDAVLGDLADAIRNAESEQEALRIAFKAFDSEGAALVNLMREGGKGLDEYRRKARELGLVLDEQLIRNAEEANNKLDVLNRTMSMQWTQAVAENTEAIVKMAEAFAQIVKWGGAAAGEIVNFGEELGFAAASLAGNVTELDKLEREIIRVERALAGISMGGRSVYDWYDDAQLERIKQHLHMQRDLLKAAQNPTGPEALKLLNQEIQTLEEELTGLRADSKDPLIDPMTHQGLREEITEVSEALAELRKQRDAIAVKPEGSAGPRRPRPLSEIPNPLANMTPQEIQGLSDIEFQFVPDLRAAFAASDAYDERQRESARLREQLMEEGARLTEQMRTPLEKYNAEMDRLDTLLEIGAVNWTTYARKVAELDTELEGFDKSVEKTSQYLERMAENIQSHLGDDLYNIMQGTFDSIGDGFKSMIDRIVADALAADLAKALLGEHAGGSGSGWLGGLFEDVFTGFLGGGKAKNITGRAAGGPVRAGGLYEVNERGPELFSTGGRDYLMMGNHSGQIIPNHQLQQQQSGGGGVTVNGPLMVVHAQDAQSIKASRGQIGAQMAAALAAASRRNR